MQMIFDREPTDWNDLQNLVAQMFREAGCEVAIGQEVALVRGKKEIDVLVHDPQTTPASTYLCECKFWSKAIPQETIHAFRTVVADYGAHRGFIVSRIGFQAGARAAVEKTNIDLVTFQELQAIFFDRWRISMAKRFRPFADRLFPYWDFPGKKPSIPWTKTHSQINDRLTEAYRPVLLLGPWFELQGCVWNLPIKLPTLDADRNVNGELTLRTYREVYDFIDVGVERRSRLFTRHRCERSGCVLHVEWRATLRVSEYVQISRTLPIRCSA